MKAAIIILLLLVAPSITAAEPFYADIQVSLDSAGEASIKGTSNHPLLADRVTQDFTSKRGVLWLLNITIKDNFSDYVYTIELPEGAEANFVKSATPIRIGSANQRTFIKGTGKDQPMSIAVEYSLASRQKSSLGWAAAAAAFLAIAGIIFIIFRLGKSGKQPQTGSRKMFLPERQKQIVELLEKNGKPMTQKQLEEAIKIPKSSVSRNIDALARSGILRKEQSGMTNIIYLITPEERKNWLQEQQNNGK